jgi:hypothetical protein
MRAQPPARTAGSIASRPASHAPTAAALIHVKIA